MKFKVKPSIEFEEGLHKGKITEIQYREEPFEYTDVFVEAEDKHGNKGRIKYGCPSTISEKSKLGRLVKRFGAKLEAGEEIDPEEVLVERKCKFLVQNKEADDGNIYARIAADSLKPIEEDKQVGLQSN